MHPEAVAYLKTLGTELFYHPFVILDRQLDPFEPQFPFDVGMALRLGVHAYQDGLALVLVEEMCGRGSAIYSFPIELTSIPAVARVAVGHVPAVGGDWSRVRLILIIYSSQRLVPRSPMALRPTLLTPADDPRVVVVPNNEKPIPAGCPSEFRFLPADLPPSAQG